METDSLNVEQIVTRERGDALELAVEHIFRVAKFKTERNVFIASYEIDVKATIGDRTIIVECKNYQYSNMTIRNLIHQWNSKNQVIRAHKIILVLTGLKISDSDYSLASDFDIELWNQNDISDLFNLSLKPDELREKLLTKISLQPLTIVERYRDEIIYLVIKPLLSGVIINNEGLYWYFNKWLRAFILTELQMVDTTSEDRFKHIELFEGTKTKKGFLNITKKRTEVDYWNVVFEQLSEYEILGRVKQDTYIKYMTDLVQEYNSQKEFFNSGNYLEIVRKLLTSRLYNAIIQGEACTFTAYQIEGSVEVLSLKTGDFAIHIPQMSESHGNILNWILTSEYTEDIDSQTHAKKLYWFCSSFDETVEKVFRIFTEYYEITEKNPIKDFSIR